MSEGDGFPAWRDPISGRFRKGHPGGFRRGSKNKHTLDAARRAEIRARSQLNEMLGRASDTVEEAIEAGDVRTAQWLIDRHLPKNDAVSAPVAKIDLTTIEGTTDVVRQIVTGVLSGDVGMKEGERLLNLLQRFTGIAAQQQIASLEDLIAAAAKGDSDPLEIDNELVPVWGRLTED